MLREAGAAQVHVRVASPPVTWPCFYGIDFATRAELIAGHLSLAEICASIGADSLGYVSLDGLTEASGLPAGRLCRACFDGQYPIPVADDDRGKHVLDGLGVGSSPRLLSLGTAGCFGVLPVVLSGYRVPVFVLVVVVSRGITVAGVRTDT